MNGCKNENSSADSRLFPTDLCTALIENTHCIIKRDKEFNFTRLNARDYITYYTLVKRLKTASKMRVAFVLSRAKL